MKIQFLKVWFITSLIALMGHITWIAGNVPYIISEDPEQAVRKVFAKFNQSKDLSGISVKPIEYFSSTPAGPGIVYQVEEAGTLIARIKVVSFLGMGWQMAQYCELGAPNKPR